MVLKFAALSTPVLADDCAALRSAMLNSGHTSHTVIVTKTDGQGKKIVTRQIQTVDNKYVQMPDGKWFAMGIATKDLNDDTSSVISCRRIDSDSVSGESTAVYEVRLNLEGELSDQKWWMSSKNLILKTEGVVEGAHYTTEYDFAHATPPPNAVSLGGK
jgi:hypothetical protein